MGPRTSISSPACSSSVRYGETSPSSSRSTVIATGSPGAEAIEYDRSATYPSSSVSRMSRCWPAWWPGQSGTLSVTVRTDAVSVVTALTLATCQVSRLRSAVPAMGLRRCGSRSSPRSRGRSYRAAPGCAPTWRSSRSTGAGRAAGPGPRGGPAAPRPPRLPSGGVAPPRRAAGQVGHRLVGRVAPVAVGHRERAVVPGQVQQRVHRHALPDGVQLGPLCDAVDVDGYVLARQGAELVPAPRLLLAAAADGEAPAVQGRVRGGAGRQDREVLGHVLAWRDPACGLRRVLPPAVESARNRAHACHPLIPGPAASLASVGGEILMRDAHGRRAVTTPGGAPLD